MSRGAKSGAAWAARILAGAQTTDRGSVLAAKVVGEGRRKAASPAARNAASKRKAARKAAKRARRRNRR